MKKYEYVKVLNLYSGIGGNRKLWENVEVTAVEIDENIAKIYRDFFPGDVVIVGDAHEYLLNHFKEYDFIWSSPPCPTHSRLRTLQKEVVYFDMKLYQEIILLKYWYKNKWLIENVVPYYKPLIKFQEIHRHAFWANFYINEFHINEIGLKKMKTCKIDNEREFLQVELDFNIDKYINIDKRLLLRNCVLPELGKHILDCARGYFEPIQKELLLK